MKHHSSKMLFDDWLTPPHIIEELGPFDLDPCSPVIRPWDTAKNYYNAIDNGLWQPWFGRVWLNPPYGRETVKWMHRLSAHGNGIALIMARTETNMFFAHVWQKAQGILFLRGRISFHHVDGSLSKHNCGAPSVLVAYGYDNADRLRTAKICGQYLDLNMV